MFDFLGCCWSNSTSVQNNQEVNYENEIKRQSIEERISRGRKSDIKPQLNMDFIETSGLESCDSNRNATHIMGLIN